MNDEISSNNKGGGFATQKELIQVDLESKLELEKYKREIENKLNEGLKETSKTLAEQFSKQVSATKIQTRWIIGTFITIIGLIISLIGIIFSIWSHK